MPVNAKLSRELSLISEPSKGQRDAYGHVVCNETGFGLFVPLLEARRARQPGGIGLIIGSGGIYSLLPSLKLDGVVALDIDSVVLDFTKALGIAITSSSSPEEVVGRIFDVDGSNSFPVVREIKEEGSIGILRGDFKTEIDNIGQFHWTTQSRFPLVQEAIRSTPISAVSGDITDSSLIKTLAEILARHNQSLSYVNFSNVHHYLENMDFLQGWTLNPTTIQYSTHQGETFDPIHMPHVTFTTSLRDYRAKCELEQAKMSVPVATEL